MSIKTVKFFFNLKIAVNKLLNYSLLKFLNYQLCLLYFRIQTMQLLLPTYK